MTTSIQRDRYRVDLAAYMDTCDRNYRRLLHLIPALEAARPSRHDRSPSEGRDWSLVGKVWRFALPRGSSPRRSKSAVKVDVRVLESFVYTTTLEITVSSGFPAWAPAPSMQLRLYHDADTAEPLSYQGHRRIPVRSPIPNARMYHEDEKRQVNEFLAEWLELCVRFGVSTPAPDPVCST